MPWHIGQHTDCNRFAVIKDSDGSLAGCHETEAEAEQQIAALYASEPEMESESSEDSEMGEQISEVTKTVDGKAYPASDFLVVEDTEQPSTWHLQVKRNGTPDHNLMGGAKAALTSPGGYRGNVYEGPGKTEAIRKLKALYDAEDMEWSESAVAQARNLIERALSLLAEIEAPGNGNGPEPMTESLSESVAGRVIAIEESEATSLVPLTLDVALIEPGAGNKQDGHYYPAEVLRRDAGVFKGGKMYATDHREDAKDVRTWVSTIKSCPVGFTQSGAPIARVVVHKEWFAKDVRALQAEGLIEKMECSILGTGRAKKGTIGETEYNIVEAITEGSADWVTRAGAGGRALALAESDAAPQDGGKTVDEKENETEVQEAEVVTLREEEQIGEQPQEPNEGETEQTEQIEQPDADTEDTEPAEAALPTERVTELLSESGLGEDAQRLLVRPYADEQAVGDAIAEFKRIIKKASGSGQPFAQGATQPARDEPITEADRVKRYQRIKQSYGLDYAVTMEE